MVEASGVVPASALRKAERNSARWRQYFESRRNGILILMDVWLRRLVEPAKTSPTDSFRWNDKRSKSKQVVNEFRIAGGLIAGFVVMMAVLLGLSRLCKDQRGQNGSSILVSSVVLVAAALIMGGTANRWAPFVTGFFFGPALLKILGVRMVADDSYYSAHSMTRTSVVEFLDTH